jgi:hypothetical protein
MNPKYHPTTDAGLIKSTRARKTLTLTNATRWKFDFADALLFGWIDEVMYSFTSPSPHVVGHMARPAVGTTVEVVSSVPATATVCIEVTQAVSLN